MDFGKSFGYVFEDENWVTKILLGGILNSIPILNFVVGGYAAETIKNVATGQPRPLPEWSDFGDKFVKGLMLAIICFVYALPMIILYGCMALLIVALRAGEGDAARTLAGLVGALISCFVLLYALALALVLPAAIVRYAMIGQVGSAFQFGQVFSFITGNLGNYILALVMAWVAVFISGFGVIACVVGVLFTAFWATLVWAHLMGQVQRAAVQPI